MADRLNPDQILTSDQEIKSNNGKASLIMQGDGNLVLYETRPGGRQALWASDTWNTPGAPGSRAIMQGDGNLVVYTPDNKPIWASDTSGNPGAYLVMQDDGNAVIYTPDSRPLWASNTMLGALHAYNEWHHPNGFHMAGEAYLTMQGQLRADITTWSTSLLLGFTGGCNILVIDAGQNIIHQWLIWPLGIGARAFVFAPSRRTDHPIEQIPPSLAAQAVRIEIWFSHMPKERWDNIIIEVGKKAEDLKKLYDKLSDLA